MKLAVISDTHRSYEALERLIEIQAGSADMLIHLGDGYEEFCLARERHPELPMLFVRGNNDFNCDEPISRVFPFGGVKLFACHGHTLGVRHGTEQLEREAGRLGASVALYGHTHRADCRISGGIYVLNPGSARLSYMSEPTFATIDIASNGVIQCKVSPLK